jgi:hypothetical protein
LENGRQICKETDKSLETYYTYTPCFIYALYVATVSESNGIVNVERGISIAKNFSLHIPGYSRFPVLGSQHAETRAK